MKTTVTTMVRGWNRTQGINYRSEAVLDRVTYPSEEKAVEETRKNLELESDDVYAIITPQGKPSYILEKQA